MLNEINVVVVGAAASFASGLLAVVMSRREAKRARDLSEQSREELAWEQHQSPHLTTNLLVLEVIGDEIESSEIDAAVRARMTPAELRSATEILESAGLITRSQSERLTLTEAGRRVLERHKLEFEEILQQRGRVVSAEAPTPSAADLDAAIDNALRRLKTHPAH